uniref:Secreted protein n=1 Tax=Mucochytrium quahogii TaxID=96639 RepID=A0A7S2S3F6_9STRA|mmetsp:Transcript_24164/g.52502  ORF Transcript_24164/g.52502 Transcript_24164/m.52502 type:complete len:100 (+) Transcript_24164:44-343(+)
MIKFVARIGLIVGLFQRVACLHSHERTSNTLVQATNVGIATLASEDYGCTNEAQFNKTKYYCVLTKYNYPPATSTCAETQSWYAKAKSCFDSYDQTDER